MCANKNNKLSEIYLMINNVINKQIKLEPNFFFFANKYITIFSILVEEKIIIRWLNRFFLFIIFIETF